MCRFKLCVCGVINVGKAPSPASPPETSDLSQRCSRWCSWIRGKIRRKALFLQCVTSVGKQDRRVTYVYFSTRHYHLFDVSTYITFGQTVTVPRFAFAFTTQKLWGIPNRTKCQSLRNVALKLAIKTMDSLGNRLLT